MIVFENVFKIDCTDIDIAREQAMRRLFFLSGKNRLRDHEFYALQNLSFSLAKGESLLITGPEDVRRAIARLICGLTRPNSGSVEVSGSARLVSSSAVGVTPFMTLQAYLYLISTLLGSDRRSASETARNIMHAFAVENLATAKIADISRDIIKKLAFYTSIFVDSDVYVFNEALKIKDPESAELFQKRLDEILRTRTVVILEETLTGLPLQPVKAMMVDAQGTSLYLGSYESAAKFHTNLSSWQETYGNVGDLSSSLKQHLAQYKKNPEGKEGTEIIVKKIATDELGKLTGNTGPVIAGPYLSDAGMELIYWIPFLRWLLESSRLDKHNLIAISRCGAEQWYCELGGKYIDICDVMEPEEFASMINLRIAEGIKQFSVTETETRLLSKITAKIDIRDYHLIHPSLMYNLFTPVWKRHIPAEIIKDYTIYTPLQLKNNRRIDRLPDDYIAVKFNFCPQFPDTPQNRVFLEDLLTELSRQYPIVSLNTGLQVDRHTDFEFASENNLKDMTNFRNLLELQTNVIAGARLFVGTHSSISYLAPLLGRKTLYIYSETNSGIFPVSFQLFNSLPSDFFRDSFSTLNISDLKPIDLLEEIKKILKI